MKKRVSVSEAIRAGTVRVNLPVLAIIVGPLLIAGFVFETLSRVVHVPDFVSFILGSLCALAIPLAWLYWSFAVPHWKLWAYSNVTSIAALKSKAVTGGLIWPDGHFFEKTEICSKDMRRKILQLEGRAYSFRPMTLADFPMAREWLATPDVQKWWVDPEGNVTLDESDLDEPGMRMWIVSFEGRPFAYLQDWDVHAWDNHYFTDRPKGARGIDQFIGVPDMIGKGHGSAFIRQHVARLFAEGAPELVIDPDPANLRAVKAYQNAGFIPYGEHNSPEWGHVLLMSQTPETDTENR